MWRSCSKIILPCDILSKHIDVTTMQAIVSNVDVVFLLLLHHVGKIPPAGSLKLNLGPIGGTYRLYPVLAGRQLKEKTHHQCCCSWSMFGQFMWALDYVGLPLSVEKYGTLKQERAHCWRGSKLIIFSHLFQTGSSSSGISATFFCNFTFDTFSS